MQRFPNTIPIRASGVCLLRGESVRRRHVVVSKIAKIFPEGHPLGRFEVHQADERYVCFLRELVGAH